MDKKLTYKDAGVDIDAADKFVDSVKKIVKPTFRPEVISSIGGFGGMFALNKEKYDNPVLVSSTDGVGTKLKIASMINKHDTIGIDLVAMCANDIIVQGAEPIFLLDYISIGKINHQILEDVLKGIAEGCKQAGCSLIGGETAEMPSFYEDGEYDVAGFVVGVVDMEKVIDGSSITVGDKIIGIGSSGIHSNGFSLVRKVFFDSLKMKPDDYVDELGCTVGEELIKPTKIYVKTVLNIMRDFQINGIAHITGGGLLDNIVRVLPKGCRANINMGSWDILPIFDFLKNKGNVDNEDMLRTFNNGIGMVLVVPAKDADEIMIRLNGLNEKAYIIGEIESKGRKKNIQFT
jgi:phosphoribosylformylglycinamidine cyclo-ligase